MTALGRIFDPEKLTDDERTVWPYMVTHYVQTIPKTVVAAVILPALEELRKHFISEETFTEIANECDLVPRGRELLFGKALYAGYNGDFITALHLLVPQLEHMVRSQLQLQGVRTTALEDEGIEREKALGSLMELPQVKGILGEDMAFEIRALMCDPFGPNIRNELAHGLLELGTFESEYAIYAWWLGLRLVFFSRDKTISQIA